MITFTLCLSCLAIIISLYRNTKNSKWINKWNGGIAVILDDDSLVFAPKGNVCHLPNCSEVKGFMLIGASMTCLPLLKLELYSVNDSKERVGERMPIRYCLESDEKGVKIVFVDSILQDDSYETILWMSIESPFPFKGHFEKYSRDEHYDGQFFTTLPKFERLIYK